MGNQPWYNKEALDRLFTEKEYDALVVRSGRNIAYLSGMNFPGTLGRLQDFAYSPRAILLLWPRYGEPALFVSQIASDLARDTSWIKDHHVFTEYSESPYRLIAEELKDRGLGDGRLGVERREMGVENWNEFASAVPDAQLEECTDELERVRNIKTPLEIDHMKRSVEIQDTAHQDVFREAGEGVTEQELHARMVGRMLSLGADSAHGMMQSSNTSTAYGGEGPVEITEGDLIRTDYVSYYQGYAANLSRMAVFGEPSAVERKKYRALRDVHYETINVKLNDGTPASEVHEYVEAAFEDRGIDFTHSHVGHSTGIWWHQEEPMLTPDADTILRTNMVVCLETILDEFWHLQDQIVITEEDPQIVSSDFDTHQIYEIS